MLVDVALLGAPLLAAFPAVVIMLTSDVELTSKRRLQKRLYATLLMAEKLPSTSLGAAGIARDIDRQLLGVAYAAQYPQRARELRHLTLLGGAVVAAVGAYYVGWWQDASLLALLVTLGVVAALALWFERALLNFARNDGVARRLFDHFGGAPELQRPRTELATKAPTLTLDEVFQRAADVRDANLATPMTTLEAVNAALIKAHADFDWRRTAARIVHRIRNTDYVWHAKRAYDWLLSRLLGPFFRWRLALLDHRERHRTARAHRAGDVFTAAWLPAHYRNERSRLASHWARLSALR